ncbi:hypothetical protein [Sphingomonas crusticola]|uniref:hypothetical protein n=1 Tax=Sphingomonas crusticola TaxID=1697973 RepID=UPI000E243EEB|nr:hypothetical protein [Sphingomonas crusticola]
MTAPHPTFHRNAIPGASPYVLALREELRRNRMRTIGRFEIAGRTVTVALGHDSLWAISRRDEARLAIRAAFAPGGFKARRLRARKGEALRIGLTSAMGDHVVTFRTATDELPVLRVTAQLTPAEDMLVPYLPRDLYPLGGDDDPLTAQGNVEAAQRGLNSGLLYCRFDGGTPGSLLYIQNLTAMNPYYNATETRPDGAVGGEWPELGYLPPTPPQSGTPPVNPLPKGEMVTLSDALLVFHEDAPLNEAHSARLFLQMLGSAYPLLDKPDRQFHDWPDRARRTLRDLEEAPEATIRHYGHVYAHPYTASEYPDAMVQVTLLSSIHDFGKWLGKPLPMEKTLAAGLEKFFDPKLRTLRRYLPNVGDDKDADAVDSWYLYHPLLGLGRMALDGDKQARRLFEDSLDYAIKAAHHFRYKWPIQYKVTDFSVITEARDDTGLGQTDVGGIYAYVMLTAYELTSDPLYLTEARTAIDAARGMRFELNYQANLTAWGAAACMRLWRITNQERHLHQSYVYLASFFHNAAIWESQIGQARHYPNFLGVTALHDAPYMALYECFDSFAAMERYLKDGGPDLDASARLMVSEYCRFALDRAWFYYPDALPADLLCKKPRNGHIDRKLSFPLEDLYVGGDIAGQVGQEIYGAGAAFIFASRAFHHIEGAPFDLFCDRSLLASDRTSQTSLAFQLDGPPSSTANLSLIRNGRAPLPRVDVSSEPGGQAKGKRHGKDRIDYIVPANARVRLHW